MKDFFKACKLYVNVLYAPVFRVISILVMSIGVFAAFFLNQPESSDDYIKTIILISIFHIGILIRNIYVDFLNPKFFYSIQFAKKYNIIVPVLTTASISVVYDIILFIAACMNFGIDFAADLMIFNAAATITVCLLSISPHLRHEFFIPLPLFCVTLIASIRDEMSHDLQGLGFSLYVDILITLGFYIVGCVVLMAVGELWWKKRKI